MQNSLQKKYMLLSSIKSSILDLWLHFSKILKYYQIISKYFVSLFITPTINSLFVSVSHYKGISTVDNSCPSVRRFVVIQSIYGQCIVRKSSPPPPAPALACFVDSFYQSFLRFGRSPITCTRKFLPRRGRTSASFHSIKLKASFRINLPLFSTVVPSNIHIFDGTTVENKGKLILTEIFPSVQKHDI